MIQSKKLTILAEQIKQTIEHNASLHHLLMPVSGNGIYKTPVKIVPLWFLRKKEEELKAERIRRGVGEPVDLGLSVKWASKNLGAPCPEQPGYYVGWGDVTCQNASTCYGDYPSFSNICGTQYDPARSLWAETWRLPSIEEMLELMQNCQWMWLIINGVTGFQITGKTGNSIFLPAGGSRYGFQFEDAYYVGRYWTGEIDKEDNARAYLLEFSQQSGNMFSLARYMGMLIRPVLG